MTGGAVDHRAVAKVFLSLLCGVQGLATVAIDLNRTHATNPQWTRHARFHVVWQTMTMVFLSATEIWLVWTQGAQGFRIALLLTALSPAGFLVAVATRRVFGSGLFDSNGILPLRWWLCGKDVQVDMNVVAVLLAFAALVAIAFIYFA